MSPGVIAPPVARPRSITGKATAGANEHMRAFFDRVVHALSLDNDVLLVGDGEVVGHAATKSEPMMRNTVGSEGSKSWRAARSRSASSSLEFAHSPPTRPLGAEAEPTLGFEPRTCCLGIGKITPSRNLDPAPEVVVEPTLAVLKLGQLSESDLVREIADACDDY